MMIQHYIQAPLTGHSLGEPDSQVIVTQASRMLEGNHMRPMVRHAEPDISPATLEAQAVFAYSYTSYRLGLGGMTKEMVIEAGQRLISVAAGVHSGEMLIKEACEEVDKRISGKLGLMNGNGCP